MRRYLKIFMFTLLWGSVLTLLGSMTLDKPISLPSHGKGIIQIDFLPEMDPLPIPQTWEHQVDLSNEQKKKFEDEWLRHFGTLQENVTPASVTNISRWSRDAMKSYRYVTLPKPEKTLWQTTAHDPAKNIFLRTAFLDTLPTEQGMRRNLTAGAFFDTRTGQILSILVTIHSELEHETQPQKRWFF